MQDQWKRLIELTRKTGDPLVVMGSESEAPCVVLPLDRYEALLGLAASPRPMVPALTPKEPAASGKPPVPERLPRPMPIPEPEPVAPLPEPPQSASVETQFYLEPIE